MISIVIPTCKRENLLPCLNSIQAYTDPKQIEIIVVANGYDGEIPMGVIPIKFKDKIGYPKACNAGIRQARGEFIVLLNDDTILLPQPLNQWLDILSEPFKGPDVAITGPWMMFNSEIKRDFICFFCCMIRKSHLDKTGLLDEVFGMGFGEDVDLSCKAVDLGLKIVQVPTAGTIPYDGRMGIGNFPIYHKGGDTIQGIISPDRSHAILRSRYLGPMIWDCFLFFNEFELLEIRLNEMRDIVHKFVLVECAYTHQGNPKPLYFEMNKEKFQEFLPMIEHVKLGMPPTDFPSTFKGPDFPPHDSWFIERYQRDQIMQGLKDAKDDDAVIISDVDEIPRAIVVKNYQGRGICALQQKLYYYYLNMEGPEFWCNSKILPYNLLKEIGPCGARYSDIAIGNAGTPLPFGGWHFSFCGGTDKIKNKIHSYGHAEYNRPDILDNIEAKVDAGEDIFNRGTKYKLVQIDETYPKYVRDNVEKFKGLGFIR